jgi:hypothetical protein
MKSKKGVELAINTVIILLLSVIVLVVLVFIFSGVIKPIGPVIAGCEEKYGASNAVCDGNAAQCELRGGRVDSIAKCPNPTIDACCLFGKQT